MADEARGKPFATAEYVRTRQFFANMHDVLRKNQKSRWVTIITTAVVTGFCLLAFAGSGKLFFLYLATGFGVYVVVIRRTMRWKWIRDRVADTPSHDQTISYQFYEDSLVASQATSVAEVDWVAMYKAFQHEDYLLIYPARGAVFCIPVDEIQPRSAVATILQKCSKPKGA